MKQFIEKRQLVIFGSLLLNLKMGEKLGFGSKKDFSLEIWKIALFNS
jgi:hypothetical protein